MRRISAVTSSVWLAALRPYGLTIFVVRADMRRRNTSSASGTFVLI